MVKVTFIDAGSRAWTRTRDILSVPELRDTTFALTDIDEECLRDVEEVLRRDIAHHGLPAQVIAATEGQINAFQAPSPPLAFPLGMPSGKARDGEKGSG